MPSEWPETPHKYLILFFFLFFPLKPAVKSNLKLKQARIYSYQLTKKKSINSYFVSAYILGGDIQCN